jgi:hypothetical protein
MLLLPHKYEIPILLTVIASADYLALGAFSCGVWPVSLRFVASFAFTLYLGYSGIKLTPQQTDGKLYASFLQKGLGEVF